MVSKVAEKIGRGFIRHVRNKINELELELKAAKESIKVLCEVEIVNLLDKDPVKARDFMVRATNIIDKYVWVSSQVMSLRDDIDAIAETIEKEYQA